MAVQLDKDKRKKDFIEKATLKYDGKFDYSLIDFKNTKEKVKIICPEHGLFEQVASKHLRCIFGCPKCATKAKFEERRLMESVIFINKANLKFNNQFDYSLVEYVDYLTKVKIICPVHGIFEQTPNSHLNTEHPCPVCYSEIRNKLYEPSDEKLLSNKRNFINKAVAKFNNNFDYSLVNYIDAKTKVKIICPEHGEFEQTPDKHLNTKYPCPICWSEIRSEVGKNAIHPPKNCKPISYHYSKLNEKYGEKLTFKIEDWNGDETIILCNCKEHGDFTTTYASLSNKKTKCGCPKCGINSARESRTKDYLYVVQQLSIKHHNFYQYPSGNQIKYINKRSKIEIICPEHGTFIKSAQKHLSGQGCPECEFEKLLNSGALIGGYCEELFKSNPELKNKEAVLYYLKLNSGEYYKIGITINNPKRRVVSLKQKSQKYITDGEILWQIKDTLYNCFKKEQYILESNKNTRVFRRWSTELFSVNIFDFIPETLDEIS